MLWLQLAGFLHMCTDTPSATDTVPTWACHLAHHPVRLKTEERSAKAAGSEWGFMSGKIMVRQMRYWCTVHELWPVWRHHGAQACLEIHCRYTAVAPHACCYTCLCH